jgi:hypothetical protein
MRGTRIGRHGNHAVSVALTVNLCIMLLAPSARGQNMTDQAQLDRLRADLQKYRDPVVAIHDGYFSTLGCVVIEKAGGPGEVPYEPGGMGVHFLNVQAISPVPDPARPQVLLYEPNDGKLQLVGAEWFIPLATGVKERPKLLGHAFDGPMQGHHPLMPVDMLHYDLHVWLFKSNPKGMFQPTNAEVTCSGYPYRMVETAPKLVSAAAPKP